MTDYGISASMATVDTVPNPEGIRPLVVWSPDEVRARYPKRPEIVTSNAVPFHMPLPPVFDPRGLCPTLARVAFIAYRDEKDRQGAEWKRMIKQLATHGPRRP